MVQVLPCFCSRVYAGLHTGGNSRPQQSSRQAWHARWALSFCRSQWLEGVAHGGMSSSGLPFPPHPPTLEKALSQICLRPADEREPCCRPVLCPAFSQLCLAAFIRKSSKRPEEVFILLSLNAAPREAVQCPSAVGAGLSRFHTGWWAHRPIQTCTDPSSRGLGCCCVWLN